MRTDLTVVADDGTDLVARVSGAGQPVVFVHGSNGGLDSWAEIAAGLSGYSCWRYARRGYPPSGMLLSRNTFEADSRDALVIVQAAREATGGRAHVVGGSYGATVALHAATASTQHIASLALFEPPILLSGAHLEPVLDDYRTLHAAGDFAGALDLFLRKVARIPDDVLAAAGGAPLDPDVARLAATGSRGDLEAMASDGTDVRRWAGIDVPVLLMQGGQSWDPLPAGMTALAEALPAAQRVVWPDHSHFVTGTAPELVTAALQRFFDGLAG